jgi:putative ABC transport system ATP-binding protein
MSGPAPALAFDAVSARRGDRIVLELPAWSLAEGQAALVLGASGSGKTTLINLAAGLLTPTTGRVHVAGQDLAALSESRRDRFRGARIGIVFQTLRLLRALTVRQNLALAQRLAGRPHDAAWINAALERLGLSSLGDARPHRLSTGEQQRAAIARAAAGQPILILADEPTSALDDANASAALALLREEAQRCGAALLIATHDQRLKDALPVALTLGAR